MKVEHFAHGGTSAHHVVFELDFSAQLLIFLPQFFPLSHVVKGQAGDAGNRGHDLQMVLRRTAKWAGAVQIDGSQHPLGDQQRNAKQRAHFQFRQSFDLTHGVASRHVTNHQADAIVQARAALQCG